MKHGVALLALLLLVGVPNATAAQSFQLNSADSVIELQENAGVENLVLEYTSLVPAGENISDILQITGQVMDLQAYDSSGTISFENTFENGATVVSYSFTSLGTGESSTLVLEFTKATNVENQLSYEVAYQWSQAPLTTKILVGMPLSFTLVSVSENYSSIYASDNQMWVKWVQVLENSFSSTIVFEPSQTAPQVPPSSPQISTGEPWWIYSIPPIVAFVFGALLMHKRHTMRKSSSFGERSQKLKTSRLFKLLSEPERKIVTELLKKDNQSQKALCEKTGIPKATVSRMVQRLESKGMIRQSGEGVWKRVRLSKWVKQMK